MNITIIGTGNMARGIGTRALAGGHSVTLLGTSAEKAEALAAELDGDVRTGQTGEPLAGDVIVLAVWYQAVDDVLATYGDQLAGKVVVDITNPVDPETFAPLTVEEGSVAQHIAARVPEAGVVKAFNTTFAGTLAAGEVGDLTTTVLIAGDDADAKSTLAGVVASGGLKAIDAGALKRAREMEALGFLQISLAANEKVSWTGGFGIVA
jgi:NADPH-dependent F420 reductase